MANPTIEQLEERVKHDRLRLWHSERQLREAQVALAPFQVGDMVEMRVWRRGQLDTWLPAVVRSVRPAGRDFVYSAALIKKDGTPYQNAQSYAILRAAQ